MKGSKRYRDGAWRLRVYAGTDPANGHKRYIHRTVKAPENRTGEREADRALARLVGEVDAGHHDLRPDDITVAQLLERWQQAHRADWSPKTIVTYDGNIRNHIVPGIGTTRLRRLRAHDLDRFYADRRTVLADATVAKLYTMLGTALAQAVRWQLIDRNPNDAANPIRVRKGEITPPASSHVRQLLAALAEDPALDAFVRLAANTGRRLGAICALQWADIDGDAITYRRALVDGGRGVGIVVKESKTGRDAYPIALGSATVAALERHRVMQARVRLAGGHGTTRWVFPADRSPNRPVRPDVMSHRWARLRDQTDGDGRPVWPDLAGVRFHDLRHFVATTLLTQGVDVATVAGRLGHATPNVTLSIYSHFIPARDQEAAGGLDELLG